MQYDYINISYSKRDGDEQEKKNEITKAKK